MAEDQATPQRITHEERRRRRRKAADDLAKGEVMGSVARRYAISIETVKNIIREHDLGPVRAIASGRHDTRLRIAARLAWGHDTQRITHDLNVSRQAVSAVRQRLSAWGDLS